MCIKKEDKDIEEKGRMKIFKLGRKRIEVGKIKEMKDEKVENWDNGEKRGIEKVGEKKKLIEKFGRRKKKDKKKGN